MPQIPAAARTRDHGDFIIIMRGASELARQPPEWSLKGMADCGFPQVRTYPRPEFGTPA